MKIILSNSKVKVMKLESPPPSHDRLFLVFGVVAIAFLDGLFVRSLAGSDCVQTPVLVASVLRKSSIRQHAAVNLSV